jgi:hypothetical protein
MIYDWFNDLARVLRVNIMAYDYTGYGKSRGTPDETSCYADIDAAYRYLLTVRKYQPEQIVLYGRSLGSGPSCYLAAKTGREGRSVAGVILQSPLLSAYRVAFNFRFTCPGDKFPNVDYAPHIRCPVFIVHGTQDEVVPFWHGQELFLALHQSWRSKPFWVEGAGHNNIEALLRPTGVSSCLRFYLFSPFLSSGEYVSSFFLLNTVGLLCVGICGQACGVSGPACERPAGAGAATCRCARVCARGIKGAGPAGSYEDGPYNANVKYRALWLGKRTIPSNPKHFKELVLRLTYPILLCFYETRSTRVTILYPIRSGFQSLLYVFLHF